MHQDHSGQFRFASAEVAEIFLIGQRSEPKYPPKNFRPRFRSVSIDFGISAISALLSQFR